MDALRHRGGGTRTDHAGRRSSGNLAAARRDSLRGMHLAQRVVRAADPGRHRVPRELRHPAGAPRLVGATDKPLRRAACDRCHRLSRVSLRSGAARGAGASRGSRVAHPYRGGAAGDDAGNDVFAARVYQHRWRRYRAGAFARVGEPRADAAGRPLFRVGVLRRRAARPKDSPARHGRTGGVGRRRSVHRQCLGDGDGRGRGVLRLGDDVRRTAARGTLRGIQRAAEGRCRDRGHCA